MTSASDRTAPHDRAAAQNVLDRMTAYSVTLSVRHLDETADWYSRMFGFNRVAEKSYPEFKTRLVFLLHPISGFRIELIEDARAKAGPARPDPPGHTAVIGVSQFAFEVHDLNAALAELAGRGAAFVWKTQRYADLAVSFFFIRDPEGNLIQFIERLHE